MKRVIVTLEDAKFYLETLNAMYDLVKDTVTRSKTKQMQDKIQYLKQQIVTFELYSESGYYQETLEEIDERTY